MYGGTNLIGQTIDGYHILQVLGRGGMGIVYKAEDVALSRPVALKIIDPALAGDRAFMRRFRSEAKALARIQSPYIVGIYALRETEAGLFIVMEYVDGGTLADLIHEAGALPWPRALSIVKQILQALHHAHSVGVIHRDIKPRNIMLTRQGQVKVTDFGLAKVRRHGRESTVTRGMVTTATAGMAGTLYYMSPEQVKGLREVDHRGDLYALGMTLYEMLVGQLPFDREDSEFTVMKRIVEEKLPPPTRFIPDLPRPLVKVVTRTLEKDPARRYQSAEEMLRELEAFEAAQAHPPAASRRRAGAYLALPLVLLLVAVLGYLFWPAPSPEDGPRTVAAPPSVTEPERPVDEGESPGERDEHTGRPPATTAGANEAPPLSRPPGENTPAPSETRPAPSPAPGRLVVRSDPPGARLFVDGTERGVTPATLASLPPGRYEVELRREGFAPYRTTVAVEPAQTAEVAGALVPLTGTLRIHPKPWGDLYIGDRLVQRGVDYAYTLTLPAGAHPVRLAYFGGRVWESTVAIRPDAVTEVTVDFNREVPVSISAKDQEGRTIRGAIYVDGQPTGHTTPWGIRVGVGLHRIEVRAEGYTPVEVRDVTGGADIPLGLQINFDERTANRVLHVILKKDGSDDP
ncbi:protein kinase [Rhodocaloribacter litoris]|uniref:serine/threonine protein kinase n=1 Tax=Rhodocaloribacter litoris TaxID=2558931 RepID=UPI0014202958|nr:serine/threonine-protein kinase [Rhodocaloribacter litoris]QXD13893.1 protein kinase [Rhodocaloribacter litoris]